MELTNAEWLLLADEASNALALLDESEDSDRVREEDWRYANHHANAVRTLRNLRNYCLTRGGALG